MKRKKIILAELRPWAKFRARSVAQTPAGAWKFPSFACLTACCRLAITVDKCSDLLQQVPREYSC